MDKIHLSKIYLNKNCLFFFFFFLFLNKKNNICCGYSLEVPWWDASNECSQCMFSWRNQKNIMWLSLPSRHITLIQRRHNVDATSWHCIDVVATLYKRHVPAGLSGATDIVNYIWDSTWEKGIYHIDDQQRPWQACANARAFAVCRHVVETLRKLQAKMHGCSHNRRLQTGKPLARSLFCVPAHLWIETADLAFPVHILTSILAMILLFCHTCSSFTHTYL